MGRNLLDSRRSSMSDEVIKQQLEARKAVSSALLERAMLENAIVQKTASDIQLNLEMDKYRRR
jgi:hypothetical protein